MFSQVMEGLQVIPDGTYLDGTFGRGGHARGVLERLGPGGRLLLMDKDPDAIAVAEREFGADPRVEIQRSSFATLASWGATSSGLDGVLLDLGVSSPQLDVAGRGFSFGKDGPLDMRMDPDSGRSAAEWLSDASDTEIADVLWTYGEERQSRRIARTLVAARAHEPITRTTQLAELIAAVMPRPKTSKGGKKPAHPATRSFQAIRIFINNELGDLETGLDAVLARLKPGGRLVAISFHSLEDRIVKRFIARQAKAPPTNRRWPVVAEFTPTLRAIGGSQKADAVETGDNPRARSAVLRVAEKLGDRGLGTGDREEQTAEAGSKACPASPLLCATTSPPKMLKLGDRGLGTGDREEQTAKAGSKASSAPPSLRAITSPPRTLLFPPVPGPQSPVPALAFPVPGPQSPVPAPPGCSP